MLSRRVLLVGLSTPLGGPLARSLEPHEWIEAIVGIGAQPPTVELERTEYVATGVRAQGLRRLIAAAGIDTVVDTRLVDPAVDRNRDDGGGTAELLAACEAAGSTVRKLVFGSSAHAYGCEGGDPAFFDETMTSSRAPRSARQRQLLNAEAAVTELAARRPDACVTVLRPVDVLGADARTPLTRLLALPVVPLVLGFDPRLSLVHQDDVVGAFEHAVRRELPGVFNVAADGVLSLSEVAGLLSKPYLPLLPPWGTGLAAPALGRLGLELPPELRRLLRFGRGVDNRRLKAAGYTPRLTSREAVLRLGQEQRLPPALRATQGGYNYEPELEAFLRRSPHARRRRPPTGEPLSPAELRAVRRLLSSDERRRPDGLPAARERPDGGDAQGVDEDALRAAAGAIPEPELGLDEGDRRAP